MDDFVTAAVRVFLKCGQAVEVGEVSVVDSTNGRNVFANKDAQSIPSLNSRYSRLQAFVNALLSDFSDNESISAYFAQRATHEMAVKQDLLPLLVYEAVGGKNSTWALPLTAVWALHLAASHMLDDAQDNGHMQQINNSIVALGVANVALANLTIEEDALRDVVDALGRITVLSASAQESELNNGRFVSEYDYFQNIAGKSASIIAMGCWLGGRIASCDDDTLTRLREFGVALGMAIQISDDCYDLNEDLAQGTYTLPVIKGLAMGAHPDHQTLAALVRRPHLQTDDIQMIVKLLTDMGAIDACLQVVRAYQLQIMATFQVMPELKTNFANYVVPEIEKSLIQE